MDACGEIYLINLGHAFQELSEEWPQPYIYLKKKPIFAFRPENHFPRLQSLQMRKLAFPPLTTHI